MLFVLKGDHLIHLEEDVAEGVILFEGSQHLEIRTWIRGFDFNLQLLYFLGYQPVKDPFALEANESEQLIQFQLHGIISDGREGSLQMNRAFLYDSYFNMCTYLLC